jgi:AAA domain
MSKNTSNQSPDNSAIPSADEIAANLFGRPAAQVDEIIWLGDFARLRKITTFAQLAKEIGVAESTVSLVMRGKYGATKSDPDKRVSLAGFARTVATFRELWTARQAIGQEPWVRQLSIVRRIYPFLDLIRTVNQIGIIWGENQSGKSETLQHYAAEKDLTAYAELPPGAPVVQSMQEIAKGRGGFSAKKHDLRDMLLRRFHSGWLLIVDEFHQTMKGRALKGETIDRVREIHNRCKTPVAICGTETLPEMMEDPAYKKFLGQIGNRGCLRLHIPTAPEPEDIPLLARAYGIQGAPDKKAYDIAMQISCENGISKLTDYFKIARQLAANEHRAITWDHFVITHSTLDSWALGKFADSKKAKPLPAGSSPTQSKEGSAQ